MTRKIYTKEAKQVIGQITQWFMATQGVIKPEEIKEDVDLASYSLEQLIHCNKLVKRSNDRRMKNQQAARKKGSISIQTTCADRLIAAVYSTLHFSTRSTAIFAFRNKALVNVAISRSDYDE